MDSRIIKTIQKLQQSGIQIVRGSELKPSLGYIPSGSILLDKLMGTRGYPLGKFIHVYGLPSMGKSLLALQSAKYVTQAGFGVIHCDLENNHSHEELQAWRVRNGLNLEHVIDISGVQDAETVLDAVVELLKLYPEYIKLVIIDSIGALTSTKTLSKDIADARIDDNPKLVSRFCKVLNATNKGATIFMIAHMSANLGSMHGGNIPLGGIAIRHWASLGLEVTGKLQADTRQESGVIQKRELNVYVKKNKVSNPVAACASTVFDFTTCSFDTLDELITLGKMFGLIGVKGSFLEYDSVRLQGKEKLKDYLANENPESAHKLFTQLMGVPYQDYFKVGV